jgi:hypothetical protein
MSQNYSMFGASANSKFLPSYSETIENMVYSCYKIMKPAQKAGFRIMCRFL